MSGLNKQQFQKEIAPKLKEQLGLKNLHQVPSIRKVTVNVGLGSGLKDARFQEVVEHTLTAITGQKPVKTKARKSVSSFKIREGMPVGMKVTMRGTRMWQFIDKLAHIVFARVRDFRGVETSCVDSQGNFSYRFREQVAFPEISPEDSDLLHGLQVTITTSAKSQEEGRALFDALQFPFKK